MILLLLLFYILLFLKSKKHAEFKFFIIIDKLFYEHMQAYMVELYQDTLIDLLLPKNAKRLKLEIKKDSKVIIVKCYWILQKFFMTSIYAICFSKGS